MGSIGQIVVSWVLVAGVGRLEIVVPALASSNSILLYNEQAERRLTEVKRRIASPPRRHKARPAHRDQQIAYTGALARDAVIANRKDFDPDELESITTAAEIDARTSSVDAFRAYREHGSLVAAAGSMIIVAMLLFKGQAYLGLTTR